MRSQELRAEYQAHCGKVLDAELAVVNAKREIELAKARLEVAEHKLWRTQYDRRVCEDMLSLQLQVEFEHEQEAAK